MRHVRSLNSNVTHTTPLSPKSLRAPASGATCPRRPHVRVISPDPCSLGNPRCVASGASREGRSLAPSYRVTSPGHHDLRISRGASMTTFFTGEQTHQAVLPQQPALESAGAYTPGSRDETAHGLPDPKPGTGVGHGRGETGAVRTRTRRRHARRLDPGSKATGIAVTDERDEVGAKGRTALVRRGLVSIELRHRGRQIHSGMVRRAGHRRRRRSANLRYRAPRRDNRTRPDGWLPPSLRHRIDSTMSLVARLCRYAPVLEIHVEQVAFDTALIAAAVSSREQDFSERTHAGSEIRESLLAKWERSCAYCGATGVLLTIEHVRPRSRGGSDRVANLVIACVPCNQAKGTARIDEFLADRPARLERVIAQLRRPLHDVAAMNTTRLLLVKTLATHGVAVHTWSGGRTSWNRLAMGLPKSHTLDALATGVIDLERGDAVVRIPAQILVVRSTGRGSYARTTPDRYGFPRLQRPGGQHRITTLTSHFDVSHRNLRLLQRADGYTYGFADEIRLSEEHGPAYSGRTLKGGDPGNVRTPDA
ncbi:RNA-guided endonuclease IscB [Streptomyces virginiae]|nr:RNA-guided endonuclease IscB [Streptomyces virginiae]